MSAASMYLSYQITVDLECISHVARRICCRHMLLVTCSLRQRQITSAALPSSLLSSATDIGSHIHPYAEPLLALIYTYVHMHFTAAVQQCSRGKKAPHCRLRKSGQTYLCTSVAKCGNWSFFGQLVHVLVTVTDLVLDFCLL